MEGVRGAGSSGPRWGPVAAGSGECGVKGERGLNREEDTGGYGEYCTEGKEG